MFKKTLYVLPLTVALLAASLPIQAANFHIVVPAAGKANPYAAIKLELSPTSLPAGVVGDSLIGFDFNSALRVTGDPNLEMSLVDWSIYSGGLPSGVLLTGAGHLQGTPTEIWNNNFQVLAKYKTKSTLATYSLSITDITLQMTGNLASFDRWDAVSFPLNSLLTVSGDPAYIPGDETWTLISGTLPGGLTFSSDGIIAGTTAEYGAFPLTLQASYKNREVQSEILIEVVNVERTIVASSGVRSWSDGSAAESCNVYRNATFPYFYQGDIGSGVYRVKPEGESATNVYCDMVTDGGGWMLTFAGYNTALGRDLTLAAVTKDFPLQTYTYDSESLPVLTTGKNNRYDQVLFKGGNNLWKNKMGDWVRFSTKIAVNGYVTPQFDDVISSNGTTQLWSHRVGWGATSLLPDGASLGLWDAPGVSPLCGGTNSGLGPNCPTMRHVMLEAPHRNTSEYPYHYDGISYRELYMR